MQCYIETSTNNDGNEKGATCLPVCLKDGCVCECECVCVCVGRGGGEGTSTSCLYLHSYELFIPYVYIIKYNVGHKQALNVPV